MFCKNCGTQLNDGTLFCTSCGAAINDEPQTAANSMNYNTVSNATNYNSQSGQPIPTTGMLVWSIIELLCINFLAGLIAIILYCSSLKPAADKGDLEATQKAKKTMKIVLWIGIILSVLVFIGTFAFIFLAALGSM